MTTCQISCTQLVWRVGKNLTPHKLLRVGCVEFMETRRRGFYGNDIQIISALECLLTVRRGIGRSRAKCINLTKTATFVTPDSTSVVCCIGWIPSNKNRWVWRVFQKDAQALDIQENTLSPLWPEPLGRVPHWLNSSHLKDREGTFS